MEKQAGLDQGRRRGSAAIGAAQTEQAAPGGADPQWSRARGLPSYSAEGAGHLMLGMVIAPAQPPPCQGPPAQPHPDGAASM